MKAMKAQHVTNAVTPARRRAKRRIVRLDSKGRVSLGKLAKDATEFSIRTDGNRIILEPMISLPATEAWLYQNPKALASVRRGLQQSAEGKTRSLGSFAKFADDETE